MFHLTLFSKQDYPTKEPEFPAEVDFGRGQRTYNMILEQLVASESKEVIKKKKKKMGPFFKIKTKT